REEALNQRGLAGADLARNHDETVGEPDRRLHVRLGACVLLAGEQELRIGSQPKRRFLEFEELAVHPRRVAPRNIEAPKPTRKPRAFRGKGYPFGATRACRAVRRSIRRGLSTSTSVQCPTF